MPAAIARAISELHAIFVPKCEEILPGKQPLYNLNDRTPNPSPFEERRPTAEEWLPNSVVSNQASFNESIPREA
eukprot:347382-Pyramimonas_sp.AAC.1